VNANFSAREFPPTSGVATFLTTRANAGIAGGTVYDALVELTASENGLVLLTRDTQAISEYNSMRISSEVIHQNQSIST